ncbi:MAG: response regulator, partial [Acidobacteria bacterium]|nr:response regulator [Acidobacteriota bacterium]
MNQRRETGSTLLVVEHNEEIRGGMKRLLEMCGYRVAVVASEQEAVEIAPFAHPALILLDASLPPPDSLSAAHRLHQHAELHDIPVVVISVHQRGVIPTANNLEIDDFTIGYITEMNCFSQLENLLGR